MIGRWNDEKHLSSAGFLFLMCWKTEKHPSSKLNGRRGTTTLVQPIILREYIPVLQSWGYSIHDTLTRPWDR
jgi:hypothetical protein